MAPTDKEIKVIALAKLLRDRKSYLNEIKDKNTEVQQLREESIKKSSDLNLNNEETILRELKDLIPMIETKIKEVKEDLKNVCNGDTNEVINRLLSEADLLD